MNEELDLDALQRLADAATSGPWELDVARYDTDYGKVEDYGIKGVASLSEYGDSDPWHMACYPLAPEDAEFIAAARSAVPALLDRVRELEAEKVCEHQNADYLRMMAERDAALSTIAKVEALHYEHEGPHCHTVCAHRYCIDDSGDQHRWPCPTARALGSVPSTGEGNE